MKLVIFKFQKQEVTIAINPLSIRSIQKLDHENTACYIIDINQDEIYIEGSFEENTLKINEALNDTFIRT